MYCSNLGVGNRIILYEKFPQVMAQISPIFVSPMWRCLKMGDLNWTRKHGSQPQPLFKSSIIDSTSNTILHKYPNIHFILHTASNFETILFNKFSEKNCQTFCWEGRKEKINFSVKKKVDLFSRKLNFMAVSAIFIVFLFFIYL